MNNEDYNNLTKAMPTANKIASERLENTRRSNWRWSQRRKTTNLNQSSVTSWKRETRRMPRTEARAFARSFLKKYPKAAYWTEVESWRMLEGDIIEFTMRRLPSAD